MSEFLIIIFSFLLGISSGFVAGLSSGGGLITIPGLIFLGLSPAGAIATSRLDALTSDLSALFRFKKAGLIKRKRIIPFILVAIGGGVLGSKLLLQIDENNLENVVGILLLLLAPILIFNKDFGLVRKQKTKSHHFIGLVVLFLICVYSAMFGGGGGIFLMYALVYFYGMSLIDANANRTIMGLFATIAALFAFVSAGIVDFKLGVPLMIGGIIGGYFGAHTAIKKGNNLVKWVLLVIVVASGLKLLLT